MSAHKADTAVILYRHSLIEKFTEKCAQAFPTMPALEQSILQLFMQAVKEVETDARDRKSKPSANPLRLIIG